MAPEENKTELDHYPNRTENKYGPEKHNRNEARTEQVLYYVEHNHKRSKTDPKQCIGFHVSYFQYTCDSL